MGEIRANQVTILFRSDRQWAWAVLHARKINKDVQITRDGSMGTVYFKNIQDTVRFFSDWQQYKAGW